MTQFTHGSFRTWVVSRGSVTLPKERVRVLLLCIRVTDESDEALEQSVEGSTLLCNKVRREAGAGDHVITCWTL